MKRLALLCCVALATSGYRAEVERMQREVLDYLTKPATVIAKAG